VLMMALLLSWSWNRVVTDCHGGPETTSYYHFQATMRVSVMGSCPTGQGNKTEPCLVLVAAAPVPFGPNIGDPGTGTTVVTWFDPIEHPEALPDPPVGGLAVWPWLTADNPHPVVAIDRAGNRCTDSCK
jgi:hypothetical protein